MQDTERALQLAESNWLQARGWRPVHGTGPAQRYTHPAAPKAKEDYTRRDALAITRGDPLRYRGVTLATAGRA
jgi:hypothetical protein